MATPKSFLIITDAPSHIKAIKHSFKKFRSNPCPPKQSSNDLVIISAEVLGSSIKSRLKV